jgi:hypothetical protein
MMGEVGRQLAGLLVDDELLAAAIVVEVAVAAALVFLLGAPTWLAGLLLATATPATLAFSVLRGAARARERG